MSLDTLSATIDPIAARLPFGLDDFRAANRAFKAWLESGSDRDREVVDVWTYCYVTRYLLVRFSGRETGNQSDFDAMTLKVLTSVFTKRNTIREPDRYSAWVAIVTRNAMINFSKSRRSQARRVACDLLIDPALAPDVSLGDRIACEALEAAIDRLPRFLREPASLRLIHETPYLEIAEVTGKPVATVRSYVHRALGLIRADPLVRQLDLESEPVGL